MATRWVKLGEVAVDSGQVLVCDPCYINSLWKGEDRSDEFGGGSYSECCHVSLQGAGGPVLSELAVVSRTGDGDGSYDVVALVDERNRVVELRIKFSDLT